MGSLRYVIVLQPRWVEPFFECFSLSTMPQRGLLVAQRAGFCLGGYVVSDLCRIPLFLDGGKYNVRAIAIRNGTALCETGT